MAPTIVERCLMISSSTLANDVRALSCGEVAVRPLPRKTPLRQMVLWGVLVVGVVILIAMALSLLRRIKPPGKD